MRSTATRSNTQGVTCNNKQRVLPDGRLFYQGELASHGDPRVTLKQKVTTRVLCMPSNSGCTPGQPQREKVRVPGARKVWGTMKTCTTQAVSTTIALLCPTVAGKLQLRRKFKKTNDNGCVTRWWFLIRGEEDVLVELQQIWECVSIQTSLWRLEECLMFRKLPPEQSDGPPLTLSHFCPPCHRHLPIDLLSLSSQCTSPLMNLRIFF